MLQIGLTCDRQLLHERIEERSNQMIQTGLIEEVEGLRKMGYTSGLSSMQSIGYRHANNYIDGIWDLDETKRLLLRDTRRYAKRQMTWFRNQANVIWCTIEPQTTLDAIAATVRSIWKQHGKTPISE